MTAKEKTELQELIKESKRREKEYKRMLDNIELLKIALARNMVVEHHNISVYKKKLKEGA